MVTIKNSKILGVAALSIGLIVSTTSIAEEVESTGGLKVGSSDAPHWFSVGGVLKVDQRNFMGSKQSRGNEFYGGANIRDLSLSLSGGVAKDVSYSLGFSYSPSASTVSVEDAYVTYKGFGEKLNVSVGQVNPGFCLENTNSSKWTPFMERSMSSTAFGPCPGLGISVNKWDDAYAFTISLTQPKHGAEPTDTAGNSLRSSDRWTSSARFNYRPVNEGTRIIQLGISGHLQDDSRGALRFRSHPEARSRAIEYVLSTERFSARRHSTIDLELSAQDGPLYAELEYQTARVKRAPDANFVTPQRTNHFYGYHAQVAYVLTGEARTFSPSLGTFGQVKPSCDKGAWEVAGRYSAINLNNGDIWGGRGNNITTGVNYYMNNNIRITAEYIHATLHPSLRIPAANIDNREKRTLHIVGLRLQTVF